MKMRTLLALLLLLLVIPADAQKRKSARAKLTPEEIVRQEKISRMRAATEKVMFIDSFVVSKDHFLNHYHPSPEAGSIKRTMDFLRYERHKDSYAYLNELGNKCFFSRHEADNTSNLYTCDYENGQWSTPQLMEGINDDSQFCNVNYPFMMGDGQTLYFAAEGDGGVGGYDIYMTTYDEDSERYLHPTNIGMPFNSEANDYMYAIDEYDSLGWFVTDRRQPQDTVCVYVFVPSAVRQSYDADSISADELTALSLLNSIADTWDNPQRLQAARDRLHQHTAKRQKTPAGHDIGFVINDDITYHRPSDFHHPGNAGSYRQLVSLQKQQKELTESLDKARNYYTMATSAERRQLRAEIRSGEQRLLQIDQKIHDMEKSIRNAENIFLTNNK